MKADRCALIAGSVVVGALLLKRFTTVLGAETRTFNAQSAYQGGNTTASTQQIIPPADIKDDDASSSQNPCDWSNLVAEKKKIDAWEKKQKDNLKAQIASTTAEANAERKGVDSQITQSKNDCAAKKQAEREAAAKAKAAKMAAEKLAAQKAKEAKRKTDVTTATTTIKAKSQETGFLAALQKWLASWGQDTTTDVPVVADEKTTVTTEDNIPAMAQGGMSVI